MNHLYYGDNLLVLRDSIATESVDLIYLDPVLAGRLSLHDARVAYEFRPSQT